MREVQPALICTVTRGSSTATRVLTRIAGTPPRASRAEDTADLGTGISPTVTSADTQSGKDSPASSLRPTLKSSGAPNTTLACALPKPQAQTGACTASKAAADKVHSRGGVEWRDPKELSVRDKSMFTLAWPRARYAPTMH